MQLTFNNTLIETTATTLTALLQEYLLLEKQGIAVAINDNVVQRAHWAEKTLQEHDHILVITAAAGG